MWVYFFVSALVYCATNAHGFCVAHSNIFPRTSAKGDEANGHQLQNLLSSTSDVHETVQDWRENALLEDNSVSQHIPHKTGKALPSKNNLLSKVSFSWVSELLATGNKRPLELPDLWTLNQKQQMHWTSQSFQRRYHRELERQAHLPATPKSRRNILADFYASPIARAILSMYKREFLSSGLVKAVNSAVQFLPAVLISRILKLASKLQAAPHPTAASKDLMLLALVLFAVLSMKTLIENMYFDMVTNLSSQVRGTLSAAIYQKALRLGPEGRQNTTLGEIVNYMQIDTARLEYVTGSIHTLWDGLFQIMGYSALLLYHLGPAVFAGILAMLFIVPFNAYYLRKLSRIREENLKASDHRVKLTNEIFQGIRAIKSYNWEQPFQTRLHGVREEELKWITAAANVRGVLIAALFAAPSFVAVVSLSTYALLGNAIDPAKVFTSLALFNQLRFPLTFLPMLINSLAEGKISLQRLDRFFALKEVSRYVQRTPPPDPPHVAIAIEGGHFGWTSTPTPTSTSTSASTSADAIDLHRSQLEDVDLHIRPGELVAVIGPTGCGKTALLSALLGEMVKLNGTVTVAGRVAYVPQSPWIPNDSLKNVVLFGRPMDTRRYFDALRVCGLLKDLDQMGSSRDETEIGERGTNLSGGQKQRTSLARAVYEDADVYLLDDPLSALDNEVGFDVFRDCIKVSLRKKTRVLVTHNLNVLPDVDRIVLMAPADGQRGCRIVDQGTLRELLWRGHDLASYVQPASTAGFSDDVSEASATAAKRVEAATMATAAVHSGGGGGGGGGESSASAVALQRLSSLAADGSSDHGDHGDAASAGPATAAAAAAAAVSGASMVTGTVASSPVAPLDMPVDSVASNLAASASAATGASSLLTEEEQREVFASQYPPPPPPPPSDDEDAAAASAGSAVPGGHETAGTTAPSPTAPHPAATVAVATTSPTSSASSLVMRNRWRPFTSQQFETEYSAFLAKSTAALHQQQQRSGASTTVRTGPTAASRGGSSWAMYHAYLTEARKPWLLLSIALAFVLANVSQVWQQWIVAAWTSDVGYRRHSLHVYLAGVAWMAVGVASFTWLRSYLGILLGAEASRHLHARMVQRTLRAPLSFFETTPIGRLIQRFSKDLDQIDQQLPASMAQLISSTLNIATSLLAICLVTPSFAPVMLVVLAIYVGVTNYYRPVARELKRLDGVSRSPIYSHFSETLQGLPVLRAFQREAMSQRINAGRLDDNVATYFALKAADRWLSFRLETLGNGIVLLSVLLAVVSRSRAGATGLSLTNALGITGLLNWAVRNAAETESLMHSVERVYATIRDTPQEAAATVAHVTLPLSPEATAAGSSSVPEDIAEAPTFVTEEALCRDGWPWAGHIVFDNVTMRYRPDLAPVLRGIDLHIRPGERVGIVGRTGSGKSSLFRGLQRLSELDLGSGPIRIDGVDIGQLGIDTVRQAISIIPQDPVLFSDTIRNNLDPHGRFTDAALWDALHKSNLGYLVASLPGGLQYRVTEGGENFSAGQRQLLCLARALVRRSKILLLDEATSSVDFETDALIQGTIRREFHRKATVLTIAHRLDTVLDADRIVVIDAGRVVECDTPPALLRRPHSLFTQLVQAEQAQRLSHG